MASLVFFTSLFLVICMHSSNARLLPTIIKHSSAKSHHYSISLQVAEKINGGDDMVERTQARVRPPPATPFSKAEFGELNEQNGKKIREDKGSEIVESSSSSHHVALLKGKHLKDPKKPTEEDVKHSENEDDIAVTDYQPPHRKTPIHN